MVDCVIKECLSSEQDTYWRPSPCLSRLEQSNKVLEEVGSHYVFLCGLPRFSILEIHVSCQQRTPPRRRERIKIREIQTKNATAATEVNDVQYQTLRSGR